MCETRMQRPMPDHTKLAFTEFSKLPLDSALNSSIILRGEIRSPQYSQLSRRLEEAPAGIGQKELSQHDERDCFCARAVFGTGSRERGQANQIVKKRPLQVLVALTGG